MMKSVMASKQSITALVPMRHKSERIPGKNFRLLCGVPLYHHIVRCLIDCPEVDQILIDTDSPVILKDAEAHFPKVVTHERPVSLRDGHLSMNLILENTIKHVDSTFYLQTHSTNPLLRPATVSAAIKRFLDAFPENDSLFSVTRIQSRLWDESSRPLNHDPSQLQRTQDLPPLYEENSCLYLFSRDSFKMYNNRIGETPILFEIDPLEAVDIDVESDFRITECLLSEKKHVEGCDP